MQQLQAPPGPILRLLSKDDVMLQPVRRACARARVCVCIRACAYKPLLFLCQNAHGPLPSVALHLLNLFTFIQGLGVVVRHQHRIQNVVCHLLLVRSSSCSAPSILWVRIDLYHLIHHRLPAAGPATFTHILSAPFPNSLNLSFHPSLPSLTIEHIGTIHMGSGKTSSVAETTQPRQWLGT